MKKRALKNCIFGAAGVFALVLVWVLSQRLVGNRLILPSLAESVKMVKSLLTTFSFWLAFFRTLGRVFCAFLISAAAALILALVAYLLPSFGSFFAPIIAVLRALPTLAVLLVILLFCGAGVAPVVVAFLTLFPALYAGFFAAFAGVDRTLIDMSRVYQVPLKKQIVCLYLPAIAPQAVRESTAAFSLSIKLVASAEVLAATAGSLGGLMQEAKLYLNVPTLFALVIVTAAAGLLIEWLGTTLAAWLQRRTK